jgi:hypothetical protein
VNDIKDIIRQHHKSVAVVFKKLGIKSPVSVDSLVLHTALKQDDFIDALADQIYADELKNSYTGFDFPLIGNDPDFFKKLNLPKKPDVGDMQTVPGVTVTAKKKSEKVKNTLQDILSGLGTFFGAKAAAKNKNAATPPYYGGSSSSSSPTDPPAQKKKNQTILFIAIGLVVILIIAVVVSKKGK